MSEAAVCVAASDVYLHGGSLLCASTEARMSNEDGNRFRDNYLIWRDIASDQIGNANLP